jgi:hypothetical protein
MTHTISASYEGADVKLNFSEQGQAELYINGVARESADAGAQHITLKLGSPVQTGYEHHEFIEAEVQYDAKRIHARLHTGGQTLAEQEIDRVS